MGRPWSAVLGVIAAVALSAVPAHASFPGGNGKIVFENGGNLFTINPDGTGQAQLTNAGDAHHPAWSPDGSRIAFDRNVAGNVDVWVMDAEGSGMTQLTTDSATDASPAWSPDGTQLAFVSFRDGNFEIYKMNSDGSNQVRLTNNPAQEGSPDWSSDGSLIAFVRDAVYVMGPDGGNQHQLTAGGDPSWSPQLDRLAVTRSVGGGETSHIFTVAFDGSDPIDITNQSGDVRRYFAPAWSPNAGQIAGVRQACAGLSCTPNRVFVMNADGTNLTEIATGTAPDWQPVKLPRYVRPRGATPFFAYFDVAYRQCTTPNNVHGAPLSSGSCTPPLPTSLNVTVGTPDANGHGANFRASARLDALPGNPSTTADEADVKVSVYAPDIRCTDTTIACTGGALSDYTGSLRLVLPLRLTDTYVRGLPATSEGSISVPVPCTADGDTTVGSICQTDTTIDSVIPGAVREGNRAIWQLGQLQLWDGGQDGSLATRDDDALFAVEGVFVP
jgi:hypothetical protein